MPSVLPLIIPLVISSAGDLRGALKWRALARATFVLLIRDPTNAKTLGTDARHYDGLPRRQRALLIPSSQNQRSIELAFFGMPRCSRSFMRTARRKIGAPGHHESRIVLKFYARFQEFLPVANVASTQRNRH